MNKKPSGNESGLKVRGKAARVLLALASWLAIAAVIMPNMLPQKYTVEVDKPAPNDIYATKDIIDTVTTNLERQKAMDEVPAIYRQDNAVTEEVLRKLNESYSAIDAVRAKGAEEIRKLSRNEMSSAYKNPDNGATEFNSLFLQQCHETLPGSFTDEDLRYIILADKRVMSSLETKVTELVTQALKSGIKEDYLDEQISSISQVLINPLSRFDIDAQRLGMNLVAIYLKANFIYDAEATGAAKIKAAEKVEDVPIYRGTKIVDSGETVTQAQWQVINDLGLLKDNEPDLLIYLGICAVAGLIMLAVWLYLIYFEDDIFRSFRKLLLLMLIVVLTVTAMWPGMKVHYFFLLNTAGALLIAVLINVRAAIVMNSALALFAGILASAGGAGAFSSGSLPAVDAALPAAIAALAGGMAGLIVVRKTPHRSALMLAGILSGLITAAIVVSSDLVVTSDWKTLLRDLGYGLAGGLVSSILCLGTLPLWESLFRVVTPMRLMELANPNHPLLKRLLMEAPGTYHHSIVVGNLAESAAEAIGANPLLTRTGAYYHDVGKLVRPYFFTENQLGDENPHESISPELSKRILTAHTKDGVDLAIKFGLPQQVQEIILEHHGTTPVMFFYHKAVKMAKEDETVSPDDYRYAGPKPHSREAAVIMLADSVEAGARALQDHSQEKLDEFVQQIVNMKLEDGQFDNCDLTMRDLSIISAEFRKVLGGIFHERIVYPAMTPLTKENGIQ